jgi:hypothetical protein
VFVILHSFIPYEVVLMDLEQIVTLWENERIVLRNFSLSSKMVMFGYQLFPNNQIVSK